MKRLTMSAILMLTITTIFGVGCGGGGGTATGPVSVNTLDGATDIPVDSTFRYTFNRTVDTTTVDTSTYFIVQTPAQGAAQTAAQTKAAIDDTICDSANALPAVVGCSSATKCELDPVVDLIGSTSYTICLTTDIEYLGFGAQTVGKQTGTAFDGFMATFTTASSGTAVTITASKLVRLDGTELDFSATPIPRKVSQKYTLSAAVTEEADRETFEAAVLLKDATENTVAGTWSWFEDYLTATFTPTGNLDFKTQYTVTVDNGSMPVASISMDAAVDTMTFTTLMSRDINGDGYDDVIVGALGYDPAHLGASYGRAYIYHGKTDGPSTTANTAITGPEANAFLGWSVGMAGDVNADGYIDVIVGAPQAGAGSDGKAYIFHGSANGIPDCDLSAGCTTMAATITGSSGGNNHLGESVDFAGDVNGDGYDDVIVGEKDVSTHKGRAYVLHGSATGVGDCDLSDSCIPDATLTGSVNGDLFGASVSMAGDVDGNGYDDVIVGAVDAHNAYVFLGSNTGVGDCDLSGGCTPNATLLGTGTSFGMSVSTASDINGDGFDDVIVGDGEAGAGKRGEAYVFKGSANGIGDCNLSGACGNLLSTITGGNNDDGLGTVYTAGDVDGDGTPDLIVGAANAAVGGDNPGQAYVFLGSALAANMTPADASATFTGNADLVLFGGSNGVSTVGDVDGDGYDDVIVGAIQVPNPPEHSGRAYIFNGSATGPGTCDLSGACTADTTFTGGVADCLGTVR